MYGKELRQSRLTNEWIKKENMQTDKKVTGKQAEINEILAVF
jgi:hypothetical protein